MMESTLSSVTSPGQNSAAECQQVPTDRQQTAADLTTEAGGEGRRETEMSLNDLEDVKPVEIASPSTEEPPAANRDDLGDTTLNDLEPAKAVPDTDEPSPASDGRDVQMTCDDVEERKAEQRPETSGGDPRRKDELSPAFEGL